jgi:hypothetical protein
MTTRLSFDELLRSAVCELRDSSVDTRGGSGENYRCPFMLPPSNPPLLKET